MEGHCRAKTHRSLQGEGCVCNSQGRPFDLEVKFTAVPTPRLTYGRLTGHSGSALVA